MSSDTKNNQKRNTWVDILLASNTNIDTELSNTIAESLKKARAQEYTERCRDHFNNITSLLDKIKHMKEYLGELHTSWNFDGERVEISHNIKSTYTPYETEYIALIKNILIALAPWRKGPFSIFGTHIDSEWRSYLKWNRISKIYDVDILCRDKIILDLGCSNAYYSFIMLQNKARMVLGVDPMPRNALFYELYQTLLDIPNKFPLFFELWNLQNCCILEQSFDTIFCMGILYHQRNPLSALESIHTCLNKRGLLVLESICLKDDNSYCLFPEDRYLKSRGYWFIPTLRTLKSWLLKSGFEILASDEPTKTTLEEQRHTEWIRGESLDSFLDKNNPELTIEGHPAPYRVCIIAKKKR